MIWLLSNYYVNQNWSYRQSSTCILRYGSIDRTYVARNGNQTLNDSESRILAWAAPIDRIEPLILAGLAAYGSKKQTACPIVRWYQRQSAKNDRTNKSHVEPHTVQFLLNGASLLSIVLYWQSILSNSTGRHDIIKFSPDKFSGKRFSYINCFIIVIFISVILLIDCKTFDLNPRFTIWIFLGKKKNSLWNLFEIKVDRVWFLLK